MAELKHIILIILLTLGIWAEEVGVPYVQLPKDAKELNIGLSRDGKTFYTYENNTLIHWNMNPIQIIDSVKITDPMFSGNTYGYSYDFDFAPDGENIIFSHGAYGLGLFDLKAKQFIKKISTKFSSSLLLNNNILQIDAVDGILYIVDINNLKVVKKIYLSLKEANVNFEESQSERIVGIFKNKSSQQFTIISTYKITIFSSKTFEKIKEIDANGFDYMAVKTSLNRQKIQSGKISFDYRDLYKKMIPTSVYCFDVNTLNLSLIIGNECKDMYDSAQKNKLLSSYDDYEHWHTPYMGMMYENDSVNILAWLGDKKLYQTTDETWLIITPDGYFDGSPESRKYLYMKTPWGESVPIDDATFQKFHKQINLKD